MSKLWQLKKLSTGEALNEPQLLPENWGPIFGLQGVSSQLADLGWLGSEYDDMGWFVVGDAPTQTIVVDEAGLAWSKAKQMLRDSDWSMLPDVPMTSGQKSAWIEYRRQLRDIRLQPDFPKNIVWPKAPE